MVDHAVFTTHLAATTLRPSRFISTQRRHRMTRCSRYFGRTTTPLAVPQRSTCRPFSTTVKSRRRLHRSPRKQSRRGSREKYRHASIRLDRFTMQKSKYLVIYPLKNIEKETVHVHIIVVKAFINYIVKIHTQNCCTNS